MFSARMGSGGPHTQLRCSEDFPAGRRRGAPGPREAGQRTLCRTERGAGHDLFQRLFELFLLTFIAFF